MLAQCSVCTDIKHFKMKLDEVRHIIRRINMKVGFLNINFNRLVPQSEIRQYLIISKAMKYDSKKVHFMCGYCYKANKNEMNNLENELKDNVAKIIIAINSSTMTESEKKRIKCELQNIVRGHYPLIHRTIQKYLIV